MAYYEQMRGSLLVLLTLSLWAQTETGQISGVVLDSDGSALSGAQVMATYIAGGEVHLARTSGSGIYDFPDLAPGDYQIEVSVPSAPPLSRTVPVSPGIRINVDVRLGQRPGKTEPNVFLATQTQAEIVTNSELNTLPNLNRNFYQFAELSGNLSDAGLGDRGAGFAIDGQRESSTNILLDGANNNNEFAGSIGQPVPFDAVQEFTLMTSSFTSEYGRASGGIVDVATKRGSSALHGSAYDFNRDSILASNSFLNNAEGTHGPSFERNEFGYSLGVPEAPQAVFFQQHGSGPRPERIDCICVGAIATAPRADRIQYTVVFSVLRATAPKRIGNREREPECAHSRSGRKSLHRTRLRHTSRGLDAF